MARNILIVDDHPLFRMGVRTYLENNFEDVFCIETDSAVSTDAALEETDFNYAFVDISLGREDGLELSGIIKQKQPACQVIVLSMHKEPLMVIRAKELDLDGYLIKEDAFNSLSDILTTNNNTGFRLSSNLDDAMAALGKSEFTKSLMSRYNSLTQREQTVFRLLAEGLNYKEVGSELGIKHKTALVHRYNLMNKMETVDQTELVKCAIKLGLIDSI